MARLSVVIAARERSTQAMLAAEALRRAATAAGHVADIELDLSGGITNPLSPEAIGAAGAALLVGPVAGEDRFTGLTVTKTDLETALQDPAAAIAQATGSAATAPTGAPAGKSLRIVAITSCPTGIAHTFMAAEGLEQGAKALGHAIHVETQGSVGAQNTLSADEIAAADLVVIAADTNVDLSRFGGKRVYSSGTKAAIGNGAALVKTAIAEARVQQAAEAGHRELADEVNAAKAARAAERTGVYKHLMTGVSYMLPFVVAGGLLIAIAFAIGGIYVYDDAHKDTFGQALFIIGAKNAFTLMVPMLSAYIAYSIADRPGITPGAVGGMLAASIGAGFLGGIVSGFLAGYTINLLNRHIRLHRNLEGLKPVLILPLLGTAIVGLLMIYVIGQPVAAALGALTGWLSTMGTTNGVLLGMLIGAMMAFDMGGPVNKAAYTFATGLIASGVYGPMAAAMVAGMTPPLGLALATKLFASRFTTDEHEAGNAAAVLGIAFITEGAIPFAARDPLRVIPALMVGSALAGGLSMYFGCLLRVPHGGVFVLPIPNAVTNLGGYLVALVAGTVVTSLLLGALKRPVAAKAPAAAVAA